MMTIQLDVFNLSFKFFIAMSQTISVINKSGACYFLHESNKWHMCWHVHMQSHTSNGKDWKSCPLILHNQKYKFKGD